jgi:Glycosyltransferase family 87
MRPGPGAAGVAQALWTAALVGGLATLCIGRSAGHGDDFIQDYLGARLWLAGEPAFQDLTELRDRLGFPPAKKAVGNNPHPPLAVILAAPFAGRPFPEALFAYQVVQVLGIAWAWTGACRTFARGGWGTATLGGLLGLWAPVWQGLDWGQPVGFVAVAAVVLWRLARASPPAGLAGAALALACCLRPFYAILAATAVRWPLRRWAVEVLSAAAVTAALFALVRLSPIKWLRAGAAVGETFTNECGSIPGLLGLTGLAGMWCYAVAAIAIAVARWRGADADPCTAAALVLGLLTYPLAWFHYDVALIPVLVWLVATAHCRGRTPALFLAALYVTLRAAPNVNGHETLQQWVQVVGRAALAVGVLLAARPGAPEPPVGN